MFDFSNILLIQFKLNRPLKKQQQKTTANLKLRKIQKNDRSHNITQN